MIVIERNVGWQVSVCTCFLKHIWLEICLCLVVVCRLVEVTSGPRPSSMEALVYRGCPCRDPPVCHRVQDDSVAKREPFFVLLGVVTPCVLCARVRGRVSRSCATENTYTPARLEALFKLSIVIILSHSYHSLQNFCGLGVFSPTELFLLVACNVAIHLVHAKCNSVSFSEDWSTLVYTFPFWGLSAIFSTGDTLYFVSTVLWASSTVVRVPNFKKKTGRSLRKRLCFRVKRRWSALWYASSSTLCPTAMAISASPGEPPCLNCRLSAVNLEMSWFKACCCPCNVFIIWTSSSTVAIWLCIDGRESCNCSNSFHNERSWEHERLYCEWFQHILRQIQIMSPISHPIAKQNTSVSPINLGLRTKLLRYHDVFFMTHRLDPWIKTAIAVLYVTVHRNWSWEMWNLMDTTVDSEKNCQNYGTVQKECWLKQQRNLIMTSPNKKKWRKKLMHWLI